jgi:hypothetical protein
MRHRIAGLGLVVAVTVLLGTSAAGQGTLLPIGVVGTDIAGPVTAIRFGQEGTAIITAPVAGRPDGPWTATLVVASPNKRDTRTVVEIGAGTLSAHGEQLSPITGQRMLTGERMVSATTPDELSVEVRGTERGIGSQVWVMTESAADSTVSPLFGLDDLLVVPSRLAAGRIGWASPGDDPSSWYWASAGGPPTAGVQGDRLTFGYRPTPVVEVGGQRVERVVEHIILGEGDNLPGQGPPIVDLHIDTETATVDAVLADGRTVFDVSTVASPVESLGRNEEGLDIDLAELAAQTDMTLDGATRVGLVREFTLVDGSTVEMHGVSLPMESLRSPVGPDDGDGVAGGAVPGGSSGRDRASPGSATGDDASGTNAPGRIGGIAAVLGLVAFLSWACWRGIRSKSLKRWRLSRRRHKARDRELRERQEAARSAP